MLYLAVFMSMVIVVMRGVLGDTDSDKHSSCPVKCDIVQEVTLLRQLLNQESLLRISVTNELEELKKKIHLNTQKIDTQFEETTASIAKVEESNK